MQSKSKDMQSKELLAKNTGKKEKATNKELATNTKDIAIKKLFGTDGIRGKANSYPMTAEIALKLGQALASYFLKSGYKNGYNSHNTKNKNSKKLKAIIGKDTRLSGYIFEYALASGLCSLGINSYLIGPIPTPAIAHLTKSFAADFGIVISASHNPAEDNGIKIFDNLGFKLSDEAEAKIEQLIFSGIPAENFNATKPGKAFRLEDAHGRYIEFVKNSVNNIKLNSLKIVIDCANGAAYKVAPKVFRELNAETIVFGNKPDGMNINKGCGALCLDTIKAAVLAENADIGIALDGDADRLIVIDEKGKIVNGDDILYILASYMKEKGRLKKDTVVATIMSNLGFEKALEKKGIALKRTAVGDRYVIEEMRKNSYNLGGEQSGHIILTDYSTTGDGLLTALHIVRIMKEKGKKLSELKKGNIAYPQKIESIAVKEKKQLEKLKLLPEAIERCKAMLNNKGRTIVRYSGTENKIRLMAEAENEKDVDKALLILKKAVKKELR